MAVREKSKRSFRHIAMGWASIEVKLSLLSQVWRPFVLQSQNKWIQTCEAVTEFGELNSTTEGAQQFFLCEHHGWHG